MSMRRGRPTNKCCLSIAAVLTAISDLKSGRSGHFVRHVPIVADVAGVLIPAVIGRFSIVVDDVFVSRRWPRVSLEAPPTIFDN